MPLYEYECTSCHNHIEVVQKFSDKPLTVCSKCSGKLKKIISNTSFSLKGGGWYKDGYSSCKSSSCKPSPTAQKSCACPSPKK